jgi:hypothetical protein
VRTECYEVELRYSEAELHAIFALARTEDVDAGGRYDARSAAINIWSHTWHNKATREESETIGLLPVQARPHCYTTVRVRSSTWCKNFRIWGSTSSLRAYAWECVSPGNDTRVTLARCWAHSWTLGAYASASPA